MPLPALVAPALAGLKAAAPLAIKFLPAIGAVGGALPGLREGNLSKAALGGGLGALTGATSVGALRGGTAGLARMAGGQGFQNLIGRTAGAVGGLPMQKAVMGALTPTALKTAALTAAPLAGAGAVYGLSGGLSGPSAGAAGGLGQAGAGIIGYNSVTGEPMYGAGVPGSALPPGMGQFGGINPYGSPIDVLNPAGLDAGRRLRMQKDAEAQRDAMNVLLPTLRKFSEQAKKDEFARSMAGAGIKQNILTNAALTQAAQQAGLQMGTTAAQQAGGALTQRYTY